MNTIYHFYPLFWLIIPALFTLAAMFVVADKAKADYASKNIAFNALVWVVTVAVWVLFILKLTM